MHRLRVDAVTVGIIGWRLVNLLAIGCYTVAAAVQASSASGGSAWQVVRVPTDRDLQAVAIVAPDEVWVVGDHGAILHHMAGAWQVAPEPSDTDLRDVAMVSPEEGWAVGDWGTVIHYANGGWREVETTVGEDLLSVAMVVADQGWAVGTSGMIMHYANGTWLEFPSPVKEALYDVVTLGPSEAYAVGGMCDLTGEHRVSRFLRYDGQSWVKSGSTEFPLQAIDLVRDVGWGVGGLIGGTIYRYRQGEWWWAESPTYESLTSVDIVSTDDAWAVGGSGTIIHYTGDTWHLVPSPTTEDLKSVAMSGPGEGWIVGTNGSVLRLHDETAPKSVFLPYAGQVTVGRQ
jgi:photosystem II stability/assembly factor-like uncharacterized protein